MYHPGPGLSSRHGPASGVRSHTAHFASKRNADCFRNSEIEPRIWRADDPRKLNMSPRLCYHFILITPRGVPLAPQTTRRRKHGHADSLHFLRSPTALRDELRQASDSLTVSVPLQYVGYLASTRPAYSRLLPDLQDTALASVAEM